MPRATSPQIEQMRETIEYWRGEGLPDELLEMFRRFEGVFDNSQRLIALFGVVDQSSVRDAWAIYEEFLEAYRARRQAEASPPTYH